MGARCHERIQKLRGWHCRQAKNNVVCAQLLLTRGILQDGLNWRLLLLHKTWWYRYRSLLMIFSPRSICFHFSAVLCIRLRIQIWSILRTLVDPDPNWSKIQYIWIHNTVSEGYCSRRENSNNDLLVRNCMKICRMKKRRKITCYTGNCLKPSTVY